MKTPLLQSHVTRALGKRPANPDLAPKLKLATYLNTAALPAPPANFGHEQFVPSTGWGMLGNDQWGDCVCAGAGHETMLFTAEGSGTAAVFTDKEAIALYTAITGFNPKDPNTDQGTDMSVAAAYRRKTGVKDAAGKVHQVGAYLALTPGDWHQHLQALYLFGAVGIGIKFPAFAMNQFNAGHPWDVQKGNAAIEGGHYISAVAKRGSYLEVVTWGRLQAVTQAFLKKYNDESIVYLSAEILNGQGKTPEGLNLAQLQADLKAVTAK